MKGIRKAISRTMSGDGSKIPSGIRGGKRRPRSPTRTKSGGAPKVEKNDALIFCNEMYTVDYVMESIENVKTDDQIYNIFFEDLICRKSRPITAAVQDLFVQTTMSAKIQQEMAADAEKESKDSLILGGSFHSKSKAKKSQAKRRVWKEISFVDCVSDSQTYKVYLEQKRDFVSSLTRFLSMKGFQNDLPIQFCAKIEIHTLLEGVDILQLLQAIQRDMTVTRLDFDGALSHTERHIPEEFAKLIDPEKGTVMDTIIIRLHYDRQSLNMEHDNDDNKNDNPQSSNGHRRQARRLSQLDVSVLLMIRRMALVLEQKLGGMSSSLADLSELSSADLFKDASKEQKEIKPFKDLGEHSNLSGTSARGKGIARPRLARAATTPTEMPSSPKDDHVGELSHASHHSSLDRRRGAVRLQADGKKIAEANRAARPARVKRNKTNDTLPSSPTKKGPRRTHSVDDAYWDQMKKQEPRAPRRRKKSASPDSRSPRKGSPTRKFPPDDRLTAMQKNDLLDSVNSVSAPPFDDSEADQLNSNDRHPINSKATNGESSKKGKKTDVEPASVKRSSSNVELSSSETEHGAPRSRNEHAPLKKSLSFNTGRKSGKPQAVADFDWETFKPLQQ